MAPLIALKALALLALAQTPAPVPVPYPAPQVPASADVLAWKGWGYLQPGERTMFSDDPGLPDFAELERRYDALPQRPDASTWRERVFILSSVDVLDHGADGILRPRFANFEEPHLENIRQSLRRLEAEVAVATGGELRLVTEISTEPERLFDDSTPGRPPVGPVFLKRYLEARFNGGSYEAEDKVYRGPYDGVLVLTPALSESSQATMLNGTPVDTLPVYGLSDFNVPGALDIPLYRTWLSQASRRFQSMGAPPHEVEPKYVPGLPFQDPASVIPEDLLPKVAALGEPSTSTVLEILRHAPPTPKQDSSATPTVLPVAACALQIAQDPDRGQVVRYLETDPARPGDAGTPRPAGSAPIFDLASTPFLTCWVKTSSTDPVAIKLFGEGGKEIDVCLGGDRHAPSEGTSSVSSVELAVSPQSSWQAETADLAAAAKLAGFTKVVGMTIGPSANMRRYLRRSTSGVDYLFDGFQVSASGTPTAAPSAANGIEEKAEAAHGATAMSPELTSLLKDPSEIVRLNALDACTRIRDAALEPDLVEASISTNPRIAEYGVRALASQGADSAKAAVLRTLRIGVTDHSRAVAADAVADLKDPKLAGAIVVLLEHKSWVTRLAAVDALNKIAGREAAIMRSAFLSQADPEIKLAVTRDLDPTNDEQMRRALWSAVNEPSDAVRLWSDYKLILSPDATMRKEGYKGVRDDSAWVRAELLRLLASHPTEEYRAAYELGVADSAATVRAAALDGFAGLEKGATADEIQNALSDDNPKVQLALIRLAKAKSMKLPKSTVDAMLSSPDSNVVAAAKELSE